MTKEQLSRLGNLKKEIKLYTEWIAEAENKATSTVSSNSGMPGGGGISDKTGGAVDIVMLRDMLISKRREAEDEYIYLSRYVLSVTDIYVRQAMKYRYVDGMTWAGVVSKIGNAPDLSTPRKAIDRYIQRH